MTSLCVFAVKDFYRLFSDIQLEVWVVHSTSYQQNTLSKQQ